MIPRSLCGRCSYAQNSSNTGDGLGVLLSETPAAHLEPANLCLTLLPTVWMVSRGIRQEDWCDVLKAFQLTGKF
ncbi:hypothetical protein XENTR_v10020549 [Xenopus tropicalis]|nr:hypothetical protein XENTR_v10020549 [Xenopus tropicalis]